MGVVALWAYDNIVVWLSDVRQIPGSGWHPQGADGALKPGAWKVPAVQQPRPRYSTKWEGLIGSDIAHALSAHKSVSHSDIATCSARGVEVAAVQCPSNSSGHSSTCAGRPQISYLTNSPIDMWLDHVHKTKREGALQRRQGR